VFCSAQSDSGTSSPGEYSGGLVMAAVNQLRGPQAPALRRFHGPISARRCLRKRPPGVTAADQYAEPDSRSSEV
jgi:hypothetical protein